MGAAQHCCGRTEVAPQSSGLQMERPAKPCNEPMEGIKPFIPVGPIEWNEFEEIFNRIDEKPDNELQIRLHGEFTDILRRGKGNNVSLREELMKFKRKNGLNNSPIPPRRLLSSSAHQETSAVSRQSPFKALSIFCIILGLFQIS